MVGTQMCFKDSLFKQQPVAMAVCKFTNPCWLWPWGMIQTLQ